MPNSEPGEILLLTRLRTLNKGNQALSAAWLSMLQRAFPGSVIRVLERRPRHLLQYTLGDIARARDPVGAFDDLCSRLAAQAPGSSYVGAAPPSPRIVLDETIPSPRRFADLRQRLNLRGWLAKAGRYRAEYQRRLSACQRARLVVVNPAGEFFPREPGPAFYHLVDAYTAHKLGRPTAIVNHTLDIEDPTLRAIIPHVYRQLDLVGFRDAKSTEAFRAMGGDEGNVLVVPDLALTAQVGVPGPRRHGTVAVAINVPEAVARGYQAGWSTVIDGLQRLGLTVVLVSNEVPADQWFYLQLSSRHGVRFEGVGDDYDRYAARLAEYDFVVTSRMHTGILAMVAGTPVIPVEGASFKITGLFRELGLDAPVVDPNALGWPAKVVAEVAARRTRRDGLAAEVATQVGQAQQRITDTLVPRLRQCTVGDADAGRS